MALVRAIERYELLERQLSPVWRDFVLWAFEALQQVGVTGRVYDVYRSPAEQERRFALGDTRAHGGQSPHQYGLAFDFVVSEGEQSPFQRALQAWWGELGAEVIAGDPAHVQVPGWRAYVR